MRTPAPKSNSGYLATSKQHNKKFMPASRQIILSPHDSLVKKSSILFGAAHKDLSQGVTETNEHLNQWKQTIEPEYQSLLGNFKSADPKNFPLLNTGIMAGAYIPAIDRLIFAELTLLADYPLSELASHEGHHALSAYRRKHLLLLEPQTSQAILLDEILNRIHHGEGMPKLFFGYNYDKTIPEPCLILDHEDKEKFNDWKDEVIKHFYESSGCIDKENQCLTPTGERELKTLITSKIKSLLKKSNFGMTNQPEKLAIEAVNYDIRILPTVKATFIEKPYLPPSFRSSLESCLREIFTQQKNILLRPSGK